MRNFFIITTLFFTAAAFPQNYIGYYNLANEAEYQFITKETAAAIKSFSTLEKKFGKLKYKDNFYLGILHYLYRDSVTGYSYLVKFTEQYGKPLEYIGACKKKFPELAISPYAAANLQLLEDKNMASVHDSLIYKTVHQPIVDSLHYYMALDQGIVKDTLPLYNQKESQAQQQFLNYLRKYGLPDATIYGNEYLTIIGNIWDPKLLWLYKGFFHDQLMKGKASPYDYAVLEDHVAEYEHKTTIYGSWFMKYSPGGDREQIAENRKKIGMSPYYEGPGIFPVIFIHSFNP